jgi:hypothetical protein
MPDPAPACPRCGAALSTAGHGPGACRQWARAEAQRLGDVLTAEQAADLTLLGWACAMTRALRDRLEELPPGD